MLKSFSIQAKKYCSSDSTVLHNMCTLGFTTSHPHVDPSKWETGKQDWLRHPCTQHKRTLSCG